MTKKSRDATASARGGGHRSRQGRLASYRRCGCRSSCAAPTVAFPPALLHSADLVALPAGWDFESALESTQALVSYANTNPLGQIMTSVSRAKYAWCTSRRFGAEITACILSACRPGARDAGRRWLCMPPLQADVSAIAYTIHVYGAGGVAAMHVALWLHALTTAVRACGRGAGPGCGVRWRHVSKRLCADTCSARPRSRRRHDILAR